MTYIPGPPAPLAVGYAGAGLLQRTETQGCTGCAGNPPVPAGSLNPESETTPSWPGSAGLWSGTHTTKRSYSLLLSIAGYA